uniref:Beta-defensin-like domain-containing protein n=1 Tax=Cairina moschata TaxID=8855 RepID=A0A8C3BND0_CAIMO
GADSRTSLGSCASALTPVAIIFPMAYRACLSIVTGNSVLCRIRGGRCHVGSCHLRETHIGRCSGFQACCIR